MVGKLLSKSKKGKVRVCKLLTVEDCFRFISCDYAQTLAIYLRIFCFLLSCTKRQIGTTLFYTFFKDSLFLNIHDFFASFTVAGLGLMY